MPAIKAVRYLRVSTATQSSSDRFGFPRQIAICEESEDRHNLEAVATVTDTISGGTRERPGLDTLAMIARRHGATAISLSEVDRLSRDITGGHIIVDELVRTGLDIYAFDLRARVNLRDIDSVREINDRLRQAHEERARIRDRTYGGLLAKARGTRSRDAAPPRVLNGYGFKEGGVFEPEARWVRFMFDRVLVTGSTTIRNELEERGVPAPQGGRWSKNTVLRILKHPLYKGEYLYGREGRCTNSECGETRLGTQHDAFRGAMHCRRCGSPMLLNQVRIDVPAIVSEDAWNRAQATMRGRARRPARKGARVATFHLQGRARCGICGGAMSAQTMTKDKRLRYYFCRRAISKPEADGRSWRCEHRKLYRIEPLHAAVRARLVELATSEGALAAALAASSEDRYATEREEADRERRAAQERLARLDDAYEAGVLPLDRYAVRRRELEAQLALVPDFPVAVRGPRDVKAFARGIRDTLEVGPLHAALEVAHATVVVFPGREFEVRFEP